MPPSYHREAGDTIHLQMCTLPGPVLIPGFLEYYKDVFGIEALYLLSCEPLYPFG